MSFHCKLKIWNLEWWQQISVPIIAQEIKIFNMQWSWIKKFTGQKSKIAKKKKTHLGHPFSYCHNSKKNSSVLESCQIVWLQPLIWLQIHWHITYSRHKKFSFLLHNIINVRTLILRIKNYFLFPHLTIFSVYCMWWPIYPSSIPPSIKFLSVTGVK